MADTREGTTDVIPVAEVGGPTPEGACLMVLSAPKGSDMGELFELQPSNVIGRGADASIRVDDHGVSRTHVRIRKLLDGRFTLEDLDSRNGTYINGVRMSQSILNEGDRIQIGTGTIYRFSRREDALESSVRLR